MSENNRGIGYEGNMFFINSAQNVSRKKVDEAVAYANADGSVPATWPTNKMHAELVGDVSIREKIEELAKVGKSQANRLKKKLVERKVVKHLPMYGFRLSKQSNAIIEMSCVDTIAELERELKKMRNESRRQSNKNLWRGRK